MRNFLSPDQFRDRAKAGTAGHDARIRMGMHTAVRAVPDAERTLEFIISTPAVDRAGDTIAVEGWRLDNFRKNPVVLWAHDYTALPVARSPLVGLEGGALRAIAEFTPAGMARFNDTVFEMYKAGFLSAVSVGFLPIKWAWVEDEGRRQGIDFLEQELLEFSCVPVPANPGALLEARGAGIDLEPVIEWAEKLLDGDGRAVIPRSELEALRKTALSAMGAGAEHHTASTAIPVEPPGRAWRRREVDAYRLLAD
jgi:HK97 family phage prohead protease